MMDNEMAGASSETNGSTPPASMSEPEVKTEIKTEAVKEPEVKKAAKPKTEKAAKPAKEAKPAKVAAWVAAGFKTMEEYRVAMIKKKREAKVAKKAAAPKKAKKAKPAKAKKAAKPAKAKKVAKAKGEPKHKYPTTAAEKRKSAERTAQFMKAAGKREEPNKDEEKLWKSIKVGSETDTDKMAELFKGSGDSGKRHSRVRNALRWLRASRKFKATAKKGTYKRIA